MRLPFWQRDEAHPTRAIDRVQVQRTSRQIIGIHVDSNFSKVNSSLLQIRGTGKHVRAKEITANFYPIEKPAREIFKELRNSKTPSESDIRFASTELTIAQNNCINQLLAGSNVTKSQVACIGSLDAGIWVEDFDGDKLFRSLADSMAIASYSGITVVDRFAERDIADGGTGHPILPVCYWFLLADRNQRIAEENRLLVRVSKRDKDRRLMQATYLPASDGLDAVLPDIQFFHQEQESTLDFVASACHAINQRNQIIDRLIIDDDCPNFDTSAKDRFQTDPICPIDCISTLADFGFDHGSFDAAATAILANSYIDQFPISHPELTGNSNPRVLGAATPGSLVNFRNFVLETAKVTPTIMKLRDAI
ncbi:anhydro-N-acetylmuramic acid kinase [Pirellulaceae bacterium]|nr:anhydro-N-acetylmuramic acid kinase [Pirellulaceae bacterium]